MEGTTYVAKSCFVTVSYVALIHAGERTHFEIRTSSIRPLKALSFEPFSRFPRMRSLAQLGIVQRYGFDGTHPFMTPFLNARTLEVDVVMSTE